MAKKKWLEYILPALGTIAATLAIPGVGSAVGGVASKVLGPIGSVLGLGGNTAAGAASGLGQLATDALGAQAGGAASTGGVLSKILGAGAGTTAQAGTGAKDIMSLLTAATGAGGVVKNALTKEPGQPSNIDPTSRPDAAPTSPVPQVPTPPKVGPITESVVPFEGGIGGLKGIDPSSMSPEDMTMMMDLMKKLRQYQTQYGG
jgi:hypothetical protein